MFHVIAEQCRADTVYLVARVITLVVRKYMFSNFQMMKHWSKSGYMLFGGRTLYQHDTSR